MYCVVFSDLEQPLGRAEGMRIGAMKYPPSLFPSPLQWVVSGLAASRGRAGLGDTLFGVDRHLPMSHPGGWGMSCVLLGL